MQIKIKELRKTFDNGTRAIQGVDLTINEGEFVVILGASGSGKTTLLRSINGLVDCEKGEIKFDGNIVSPSTLPLLRKQTGMVFQDFNLVNNLSSINNVLTGLLDSSNTLMSMMYLFTKDQKKTCIKLPRESGVIR